MRRLEWPSCDATLVSGSAVFGLRPAFPGYYVIALDEASRARVSISNELLGSASVVQVPQDIQTHALDLCDPSPVITFVDAVSNQPDNGLGDGDTEQDLVVKDGYFCARAERSGVVGERIYTVTVAARDASGNVGRDGIVQVKVVHDQRDHDCPNLGGIDGVDSGDPRCQPDSPQVPAAEDPDRSPERERLASALGCSQHLGSPESGWSALIVAVVGLLRRRSSGSRR